jgi:hypothetical protein
MDKLMDIVSRSIEDYGFRQVAQWSPDDVVAQWQLSDAEAQVLKGPVKEELDRMPIPVEPEDVPGEQARLAEIIKKALA